MASAESTGSSIPSAAAGAAGRVPGFLGPGPAFRPLSAAAPGAPQPAGDPYLLYVGGALPFRMYLANLELGGVPMVHHVALLIQPNEYPGTRGGTLPPGASNLQFERAWDEAARAASVVDADGLAGIDRRVPGRETILETAPVTPPVALCRKTGAAIRPLCPSCLEPVALCRDELFLRRAGLPSYRASLTRFLYCPACAAKGEAKTTVFTFALRTFDGVSDSVRVRRRGELYRDLASRVHGGADGAASEHACFTCEHRQTCYPAGKRLDESIPAEAELQPLAYYDSAYLPVEALPFEMEDLSALLGGAPFEEVERRLVARGGAAHDPLRAGEAEALRSGRPQFLYQGDSAGLFGLEVFYLKASAFASLARGVLALHAAGRRPHLALSPARLRGGLLETSSILPSRWNLVAKIAETVTTAPLAALAQDRIAGEPGVWAVPYPLPEAFLPEAMSRPQSENLWMRLTVQSVTSEKRPEGPVVRLEAALSSEQYLESEQGTHDLIRLYLQVGSGAVERVSFAGRKIGALPGGFRFSGVSGPLSPEAASAFDPSRAVANWNAEVSIHHSYGAPSDLVSLGILFLRFLLGNDRQDGARFERDAVERLAAAAAGDKGATGHDEASERGRLVEALAREGVASNPTLILWSETDRAAGRTALPSALWEDALLVAVKMASLRPGWSLCAGIDDYTEEDPARPIRLAVAEIEALADRARGELIGSSGRNRAVLEVCDDLLADVHEAASSDGGEATSPRNTVVGGRPR